MCHRRWLGEPIEILVVAARGLRGDRGEAARRDRDVLVAQLLRRVARALNLFAAIIDR